MKHFKSSVSLRKTNATCYTTVKWFMFEDSGCQKTEKELIEK